MMIDSKKIIVCALIVAMQILTVTGTAHAEDIWEMTLIIKKGKAEQSVSLGQRRDATDSVENRYDIPAFIGGEINAYFTLQGNRYWQDIRKTCRSTCMKQWRLIVDPEEEGGEVTVMWRVRNVIDQDITIHLNDLETGRIIDIDAEKGEYSYLSEHKKEFIVEVNVN